jgi:hypothetical protein
MNIFRLDNDPVLAAQYQCDKHVVKMIVESAQMLSTVHRMLDGVRGTKPDGKPANQWHFVADDREDALYRCCHMNHPSTVWTRESKANYEWHYAHFIALCDEYTYRYGKVHKTDGLLRKVLNTPPVNIPDVLETPFKLAMNSNPECQFPDDPVKSYRLFYQTKQDRFKMVWTGREIPEWFEVK